MSAPSGSAFADLVVQMPNSRANTEPAERVPTILEIQNRKREEAAAAAAAAAAEQAQLGHLSPQAAAPPQWAQQVTSAVPAQASPFQQQQPLQGSPFQSSLQPVQPQSPMQPQAPMQNQPAMQHTVAQQVPMQQQQQQQQYVPQAGATLGSFSGPAAVQDAPETGFLAPQPALLDMAPSMTENAPPPPSNDIDPFGLNDRPRTSSSRAPDHSLPEGFTSSAIPSAAAGTDSMGAACQEVVQEASRHRFALEQKRIIEQQSQTWHSSLWTFPVHQQQIQGTCGCAAPVTYKFQFRVATFNNSLFEQLSAKFLELHNYNISGVFMSLYDQTFAEMQLSRTVHAKIQEIAQSPLDEQLSLARALMQPLFEKMSASKDLSNHSRQLMQALVLFTGAFLISIQERLKREDQEEGHGSAVAEVPHGSLLDIGSSSPAPVAPVPQRRNHTEDVESVLCFLAEELASAQGLEWGCGLLHPTIEQSLRLKLVSNSVSLLLQNPSTTEGEFLGVLRQVPWQDLPDIADAELVKQEVEIPLKKLSELAGPRKYNGLLVAIGNIFMLCAAAYRERSFDYISAISSGHWPMKLVCSGVLHSSPLANLDRDQLAAVFGNLYNLSRHLALDYSKLAESARLQHREEFVKYILSYPMPAELRGPRAPSNQPVLFTFYQIAGHVQEGSYLQRLIVQELFFHAFSLYVPRCAKSEAHVVSTRQWQGEATSLLSALCLRFPALLSTVIYSIGQNLGSINVDTLKSFLQAEGLFDNWQADQYSVNWLAFMFGQRAFPNIAEGADPDSIAQMQFETLLCQKPTANFNPQLAEIGRNLGQTLFGAIRWRTATAATRLQAAVVLVGGCRIHPPGAILEKLLGSLGQELITAPLDKSFVNAILHGNLEACATPMSVIFLQLLVGLAIVEEQYEFARINQRPRQPNEGYRWLASWGFFARAQQLLSSPNTRPLLPRLLIRLDVLKEEPDLVAGPVKEFLEVVVQHNKAETQEARMALCESLLVSLQQNGTEDLDHSIADAEVAAMLADERREKRLSFWYRVLTPSSKNDTTILAMLDDLIAYCYCSGDSLEGAKTLQAMNLSRDDIVSLRASRYFWVMLLSLFTFTPTYPSNARDKQNAFHLLHETATQLNTEAAAVAYWLQMFMVFHGAPPSIVVAPPQLQERLSKRFVAVAKHFEGSDPQLHKLYYAFSTWKKGIIDASTGDFHEEQNIWILDSLYRLLPPRFQVKAPNRNKAPIDKPVFKPFVNAETVDKVVAMLPVPVQRPPNKLAEDMERYVNLEHAISNAVAYFHSIREGSFRIGEPVEVPAVQQLHFLLQGYSAAAAGLRQLDEQFLDFTTKSHYNHQAPFQVRVACTRGTDQCKQPAILQGVSVRVEPQQPGVLQAIQANRQTYNTKYVQFFDIARTVAQAVVLLKHSLSQAIGTLSPQLAVALFFTIAEHMIVSGVVAPDTAIARHVVEVLMLLGERHIRQNREVQPPLLELLLRVPAPQKKQPTPMRAAPSNQSASAAPAPLASDSADVEARRASGQAVDAEGSRFAAGMLFTLFTPRCFIQVGDSRAYLQTLQTLCRSPRSDEAIAPFSRCFSAEDYLSVLGQSPSEEDVSFIFNVLPDLLSRPVFSEVGSAFLRFLVERGQQRRVLGLLFSQHVAPEFASRFLTNVSSSSLDLSTAQTMLTNFATSLPVASGPAATVGMSLVRKFTLECEAFMAEFKRQTAEAYDDQRRPVESELWRLVAALFSRNGLLSEITPSSDEQLAIVLDLLLELVLASPEGLVDKCWYLITASVLPALSAHTQARGQLPHTDAVLARMGESLPWHLSKILFYDRNAIEAMSAGVSQQATFVATVFGKLSWQQFFTQLRSAPDATMVSEVAVAYLRLFLTVATLSPASIPQNVRNLTSFVAKREAVHTVTPFVDWPSVDAGIFAAAFDGEALLQPVKAGLARSDPSTALMENVFLLRDIALQMNDARAGVAVVREVRSLLFFAVECGPEEYWYLSLPGQTAILSGALVPLTHHFGAESRETKEMALSVVSCLLNTKWPTPYLLPVRGLSNARTYPGAPGVQEAAFDEFQEKVRGLVLQCCHTASPILALHVLRVAPLPNYATDQVDDSSVSPGLWVDLLEQTLRSYFRATEDDLPLTQVASSVQLYIADRSFMIATCRESRSAFALFAVLQQWRKEFMEHSGDRWPAPLLDAALGFVADQYRDFDILLMWFLFLDLAADRRFFPVQCQQEATRFLHEVNAARAPGSKLPANVQLAAGAVELYFYLIIRTKSGSTNPRADAALVQLVQNLTAQRSNAQMAQFQPFFNKVDEFLAPLYDLATFKLDVLATLFPTAQPLLERAFASPQLIRDRNGIM